MERQISVGIFRPKYVDHLPNMIPNIPVKRNRTVLSIWIPTEITGIFGIMESTLINGWFEINIYYQIIAVWHIFEPKDIGVCGYHQYLLCVVLL